MKRRFVQCDVFSHQPTKGNALAVVVDGEGLTTNDMQAFAKWTQLAETTFITPPKTSEADYELRIFDPEHEMKFAGHPTLGSAMAWLHAGGTPKENGVIRQDCGVGVVEIDVSKPRPAFKAPQTSIRAMEETMLSQIVQALKCPQPVNCAILENGPLWHLVELEMAEDVLAVEAKAVNALGNICVGLVGRHHNADHADYEVRMLCATSQDCEDPVTGSLNAALAGWLDAEGRLDHPLTMAQGQKRGRDGRVYISKDEQGRISVGGDVQILIQGTLDL